GDGFAAARNLSSEGVAASCVLVADESSIKGAARTHLKRARKAGVPVLPYTESVLHKADLVVDAIFGTGFHGAPSGLPAEAIAAINKSGTPTLAIDIPSGVDGATGRIEGEAVVAHATVAMAAEKLGTALPPGTLHAGRVSVADIGIQVAESSLGRVEAADVSAILPRRSADAHKRSVGSVALLGGSAGMTGAIVLAARGAVRAGAGYATVGTTRTAGEVVARSLPEVLWRRLTEGDSLDATALDAFEDVLARADALALGPGLGTNGGQRELVAEALGEIDIPVCVDADALNVLATDPSPLERRGAPTVLTPHAGELARLLGTDTKEIVNDRLGSVRAAARRFGCVVLLKGFRTLIARPDGFVAVNPTGSSALASAGTGDVLTGAVSALLAVGVEPFAAAYSAAFVHGLAGDLAEARAGAGVLAWDVAEALSKVILELREPAGGPWV
ncbi:MAG TPA: NAD(P)H-hydrate dehydratase, partial [Actinomycetota bacterium]|nr:NAD(P)H-hydrate dehydratase [Actinomycetota bacterium]